MPINLEFQPPLQGIADAAQAAGFGKYLDRQQTIALQQQAQAMQDQHFRQQLAANLYRQQQAQMANQASQVFNAARQSALMNDQQQFHADRDIWARENQQADMNQRREQQLADLQGQRDWEVERMPMVWGFQAATRGADEIEQQVGGELTTFSKQRQYMSDEGKNALAELQGKYRAIQKSREWARPQQYAQALAGFGEEVARADLAHYVTPPKTIEEAIGAGEAHETEVLGDDGSPQGKVLWTRNVRNGAQILVPKFIPHKDKPDPLQDFLKDNLKHFVNPESGEANVDAALAAYQKIQSMRGGVPQTMMAGQGMTQPGMAMGPAGPQQVAMPQQQAVPVATQPASTDQPKPRAHIESLPAKTRQVAESLLPRPKSMEEAMNLPPGTEFITPDGRLKRVPFPPQVGGEQAQ